MLGPEARQDLAIHIHHRGMFLHPPRPSPRYHQGPSTDQSSLLPIERPRRCKISSQGERPASLPRHGSSHGQSNDHEYRHVRRLPRREGEGQSKFIVGREFIGACGRFVLGICHGVHQHSHRLDQNSSAGILVRERHRKITSSVPRCHFDSEATRFEGWKFQASFFTRTLYSGHVANLGREGVFTMVYLGLYDRISNAVRTRGRNDDDDDAAVGGNDRPLGMAMVVSISSFTGACAWMCNYPFDTVKTVMQAGSHEQVTVRSAIRSIYRSGGWKAFWRGAGPSTVRAMLVTSSRMLAYETTLQMLR